MERTAGCRAKLERMNRTLHHREPDRVPVSDFYWDTFLRRWREELGLPKDTDIYAYYDLDWRVTIPNLDPHVRPFEVLRENETEVVVRTGYEAVLRKKFADPMPQFVEFATDTIEKLGAFQFDSPWDERRFLRRGDNQIGGVGDTFERDLPAWIDTVRLLHPRYAVFGSVTECYEMLWRVVGSENALLWMGLHPAEVARFVERLGEFCLELTRAQIEAAGGLLDGMVIWGDVAYRGDLLFSPEYWRANFKPVVRAIVEECHRHGLPVIYHGDGNVARIVPDFIECGIDAYHPFEAKAGHDAVELRRRYGHTIGICGNMDVQHWADAPEEALEREVLTKLNAAKGGGFIFQSDHSVPASISGPRYDSVVRLVRSRGTYPLELGPCDLPDL